MAEGNSGWNPRQLSEETDKPKTAVALAYEPGDAAPKILATGKGHVAEKIIEKAKEEKVPFYKDQQAGGHTFKTGDR